MSLPSWAPRTCLCGGGSHVSGSSGGCAGGAALRGRGLCCKHCSPVLLLVRARLSTLDGGCFVVAAVLSCAPMQVLCPYPKPVGPYCRGDHLGLQWPGCGLGVRPGNQSGGGHLDTRGPGVLLALRPSPAASGEVGGFSGTLDVAIVRLGPLLCTGCVCEAVSLGTSPCPPAPCAGSTSCSWLSWTFSCT